MAMTSTNIVPLIVVAIIIALRTFRCTSSIQFEKLSAQYLRSTIWKIENFGPCILQDWLNYHIIRAPFYWKGDMYI
jgi:hypothetical protein